MTIIARPARGRAIFTMGLAALLLASCSSGQSHQRDANGKILPNSADIDPVGTAYTTAVAAAEAGHCGPDNVDVLTCFSYRGHGYEGAQTALGECLVGSGKSADGLKWLKRAADAGWPDAQKRLAELYAAGKGVPQDNVEAATWDDLYVRNPSLLSLGVEPDRSLSQQLRQTASAADLAAAQRRADAWAPVYWTPTEALNEQTASSCRIRRKKEAPDVDQYFSTPDQPNQSSYPK